MKFVVWDDGGLIGVETALRIRDHRHDVELSAPRGLDPFTWVPPVEVRPVALTDVAALLAHTAVSRPRIGVHEIAGPEQIGPDAFLRAAPVANAEYRRVFTDVDSPFLRHISATVGPPSRGGAFIAQTSHREWFAGRPSPETRSPSPERRELRADSGETCVPHCTEENY